jgi:hypothetical protein
MAGGVATIAVGAAVVWTYRKWSAYRIKKYKQQYEAEVNAAMDIWRATLEKIAIPDMREVQGFPPIFKAADPKDAESLPESMHFTRDQIADIGKDSGFNQNDELDEYYELIADAISALKKYYLSREETEDPTAGVLSYLLQMISQHCYKFEGFVYDIAFLDAITDFISRYMSIEGSESTSKFSHLSEVKGYLSRARVVLERQQRSRSLGTMLAECHSYARRTSTELLTKAAQMITPSQHWSHIQTATRKDLSEGVLHRPYSRRIAKLPVPGRKRPVEITSHEREIKISESIFSKWFSHLVQYYLNSIRAISTKTINDDENVASPEALFVLPDLNKMALLSKKKKQTKTDRQYLRAANQVLDSIQSTFKECDNFVMMILAQDQKTGERKFVHAEDITLMHQRSKEVVARFFTLIHKVTSLQSFTGYLSRSVKQLGEIYVKNPRHFIFVFSVFHTLLEQIKSDIQVLREAIQHIQEKNDYVSRLVEQEAFPNDLLKKLEDISITLEKHVDNIERYRKAVAKSENPFGYPDTEAETEKQRIYKEAEDLAKRYQMPHQSPTSVSQQGSMQRSLLVDSPFLMPHPTRFAQAEAPDVEEQPVLPQTFWQRHRYKIFIGIVIGVAIFALLLVGALSLFSGGALSPIAAVLAAAGYKLGAAAVSLAWMDALLGGAMGAVVGLGMGGGFLFCTRAIERHEVDYQIVSDTLVAGDEADRAMAGTLRKLEIPEEDLEVEVKPISRAMPLNDKHKRPATPAAVHSTAFVIAAAAGRKAATPVIDVESASEYSASEYSALEHVKPEPPVFSLEEIRARMHTPTSTRIPTPMPTPPPTRRSARSMNLLPPLPVSLSDTKTNAVATTHVVAAAKS